MCGCKQMCGSKKLYGCKQTCGCKHPKTSFQPSFICILPATPEGHENHTSSAERSQGSYCLCLNPSGNVRNASNGQRAKLERGLDSFQATGILTDSADGFLRNPSLPKGIFRRIYFMVCFRSLPPQQVYFHEHWRAKDRGC